ncbi:MAG: YegS/Rv2252/BmrU family lipid kinase [Rhodospirillales bacterium]|nr:YegS/Rv2252/BmrU family lipid kinase [Rhodospirillales bacterium]
MTLRILVIHNPVAGRHRQKRLQTLLDLLAARGFVVDSHQTGQPGDAGAAARQARDVDYIIAAGGDGTVNEIVNGLCARSDPENWPAVGFLPMGTANVLAWELKLPSTPEALVNLIAAGKTCAVRPGIGNGRRFVLMASAGFDARAVAAVGATTKRLLGGGAYVIAALRALLKRSPELTVRVDGEAAAAHTVIVSRGRCYGGPFVLIPEAGLQTPVLHAVLLQSAGFAAGLRYSLALVVGRLHRLADVRVMRGTRVEVEDAAGAAGEPVQLDGDILSALPLALSLEKNSVRFLVP